MMRILRLGTAILLVNGACGPGDNSLQGSIGSDLSLDFDEVRIVVQPDALRVEYIRDLGTTLTKVCKIAVDRDALDPGMNVLTDRGFLTFVSVSRSDLDARDFPDVSDGILELDDLDMSWGSRIEGGFAVDFVNGKTLRGEFSGEPIRMDSPPS